MLTFSQVTNTLSFVGSVDADLPRLVALAPEYAQEQFPDPVREVCARGEGERPFALSAKGWGVFTLRAQVTFTDGSTRALTHRLHFDAP